MRFVRVASSANHQGCGARGGTSSSGGGGGAIYTGASSGAGLNDDDRLNLAEYQMFDDSLLSNNVDDVLNSDFTYRATFNDMDDVQNGNRNPYRSLTIKT